MHKSIPPYNNQTVRDWVRFVQHYDITWQTVHNGATRFTDTPPEIDQDVYHFGISAADGVRLIVYSRELYLTEGGYLIETLRAPNGFTGGTEGNKSTIWEGHSPSACSIHTDVTPGADLELLDAAYIQAGSESGINQPAGASAIDGVITSATTDRIIRITRDAGGGPYRAGLLIIGWDEEIII